ncbi:MAG TPA: DnaB-like helicase C-terminal domain-containing protein [Gemmatimonadaceae bacterium]|nr:DnaB-like helicase C-terminal domain-containing protein [Gemmatimonadaceae bacterium]
MTSEGETSAPSDAAATSLPELLGQIDAIAEGAPDTDTITSGFPSLDRSIGGGFRRGDLAVLGGDVGSGKSAFALAMALRSAERHSVAYFSAEMTPQRLMERVLAMEGRVRVDELRQGTLDELARARVGAAAVRLRERLPRFGRVSADTEDGLPEGWDEAGVPDLVIIDAIQGIGTGRRDIAEEQASAVRALKTLALDAGIAILATAQLPLLVARADRRPLLDDFGALGAVKHHADVALALYREGMYDNARDVEGATELLVRKNRHGGAGYVDLYFYAQWMRFEDMLDPDR